MDSSNLTIKYQLRSGNKTTSAFTTGITPNGTEFTIDIDPDLIHDPDPDVDSDLESIYTNGDVVNLYVTAINDKGTAD